MAVQRTDGDDALLDSEAARSMFPGFARMRSPPASPAPMLHGIELELLLLNLVRALQHVKTLPGSGDIAFIRSVRGRRASRLTDDERTRLLQLRWTYRIQLPEGLRPTSPPG
jgi:hypothetical protein